MCVQNLMFVALPVPKIIGVTLKFGKSLDTHTLSFFAKFLMGFCSDGSCGCRSTGQVINLKSVALPVPEVIAIGV